MIYNVLNILFIFLVTIIIAYLFGFTIINIIDERLNKLNLNNNNNNNNNNNDNDNFSLENFDNKKETTQIEISNSKSYNFNSGKEIKKSFKFDSDYYNQMQKDNMVEGYTDRPEQPFKGWDVQKKITQVCCKNHIHAKDGKDTNCSYGVTNYADPNDMSPVDYKIFNLNYPSNLTLQDYINWLYCFVDKEDQLPYNHLKNLQKIKMGKELTEEHGVLPPPNYYYPALNAKDYFDKMYNEVNEFSSAPALNSNTGPMVGYNYNEYSEFSQNSDLYGSTGKLRNKDIALKKDAKKLRDYVEPKDSNSLNIDKENEIYRIKNVEV